ncbi:MAG: tryptophan-rich sensory protein [Candidatus Poseidoniaceae archaeon]|nr:tryptophan-rich sensory protein [Candidatus Poseidoniaceae archaeon]MBL6890090.1 tryptophan-rich sensory protein [Candidatus Poseidoniaceae archaeon]
MTFNSEYEPFFRPPGWIVGPIWAVLYTMLAFSIYYTIMNRDKLEKYNSIVFLFLIQLILNVLWPSVFNSAEYLISLVMLILIIAFSLLYANLTFKPLPTASKLVWPYIAWVTFAALINTAYFLEFR